MNQLNLPTNKSPLFINLNLFHELKADITATDFRVLLTASYYTDSNHTVLVTQKAIADELKTNKRQIERSYKRLIKAEALFKDEETGSIVVNHGLLFNPNPHTHA